MNQVNKLIEELRTNISTLDKSEVKEVISRLSGLNQQIIDRSINSNRVPTITPELIQKNFPYLNQNQLEQALIDLDMGNPRRLANIMKWTRTNEDNKNSLT